MKTAAATLSVVAVVVLCSCIRANNSTYRLLGPFEGPSALPFSFSIDRIVPVFTSGNSPVTGGGILSAIGPNTPPPGETHWSALFARNHWLIVLCVAVPLIIIIGLLGYAWYCTKKHARIVQDQRDRLSKALEDLRSTEHKLGVVESSHKALEKVAEAERLQKALLNAVTETLILFDHDENIVALNDTAAKRFGMTVDDLVGMNASELKKSVFTEEEFSRRQRIFKEVITSGKPAVTRDARGGYIFDDHYFPLSNGQGQVTGVAIFARDVTQQHQLFEALKESEESLKHAQSAARIGSWDWLISEGKLVWSNETYRQFGLEPGQITPSFEAFERFVHPGDRQAVKEALEGKKSFSIDVRMVRMDGSSWIMRTLGTVYRNDDGTPVRFVGTQQDVTEQKQLEQVLMQSEKTARSLLNATTDAALLLDREGRVITANEAMAARFKTTTHNLAGRIIFDLMPAELALARRSDLAKMIQSPAPMLAEDERKGRVLRNSTLPILDDQGQLVQVAVFSQDITAERRAQGELEMSERRMRVLFESMDDMVFVIDRENRFTEFYQPQHEDFYVPSDDFIGKRYDEVLPPDLCQKWSESIGLIGRTGEAQHFDYSLDIGGKVEWFAASLTAVPDIDGETSHFLAVIRNITERKQLEEALTQSERTARALLDATNDAAVLLDTDGRVITANQSMAERFDTTTEDMILRSVFDFMPEDLARAQRSMFERLHQSPSPTSMSDERNGRSYLSNLYPILNVEGKLVQLAIFSKDITDEKRAQAELSANEERYRTLVDSSPYGIMVIDAATRKYKFVNPEFSRILGYSLKEMRQKSMGDLSPKHRKSTTLSMYPDFQRNKRNFALGIPMVQKDGDIKHFDVTTVPTMYEGSESLMVMLRDISEEMEGQRKIHEQAGLLERLASRLIDIQEDDRKHIARELHDGIAQDLSVAKIKLETSILDALPRQKNVLRDASQALTKALRELRTITTELRPPIFDRLGFQATIEWYLSSSCGDIEPILKVDGDPDGLIESRQLNLFRILQEIVHNARKHSDATRIEVELRFGDRETELSVKDNGRGFDFEQVKRKWREDTSFGLLNIVERVELLGGQLDITTGQDMGTTFQISIANS